MKMQGLWKKAAMPVLAAVMVLSAAAVPAESYFTTYVTAQGGYTLQLHDVEIIPHEQVQTNVKNISVENTGNIDCYVRARAVSGGEVPVSYAGAGWFDGGDGYWYYDGVVEPGATSGVLQATITLPMGTEEKPIPEGTTVNVVVVTEGAKVFKDDEGTPKPNGPAYEGWALKAQEG